FTIASTSAAVMSPRTASIMWSSGLAPAAEHEAAEGEAEPEGADGEAPDRDRLAPGGETLPAPERLALLLCEGLAAALLAQRAARSQSEVQVVEDLRLVVGHRTHCIACFAGGYAHPPRVRPARGCARRPGSRARPSLARRARLAGARRRERRPHAPGAARPARARSPPPPLPRRAAARGAGKSRHSVHGPGPRDGAVDRVRARMGDDGADLRHAGAPRRRPQ